MTVIQDYRHISYKVVWYSHLLKHFPQFVVINTVNGFGIVNKADAFLELSLYLFPDHLTCLLRNLHADQEAMVRNGHGTSD